MKILEELRTAKGFTAFLATTYNLDLPWFEALLLRQLGNNGVKRFAIFADADQLSKALSAQPDILYRAGRTYFLQGVRSTKSFHPKILLLAGEKIARLYVGSGNLSRGGLQNNLEIFERWNFEVGDERAPSEFAFVRDYFYDLIEKQIEYCPKILRHCIDRIFALPALARPSNPLTSEGLIASPSAIFNKIPTFDECQSLRIVSPFFDEDGKLVSDLAGHFKAKSLQVITDIRNSNLTQNGAKRIEELGGKLLTLDASKHKRTLHAKMYFAAGSDWSWGAIGSANASIAAWYALNGEVMSVKEGPAASILNSLIEELNTRPLSKEDWLILEEVTKSRDPGSEDRDAAPPRILFAEWISLTRVSLSFCPGAWEVRDVEFFAETPIKVQPIASKMIENGALQVIVAYPATPDRTKANLLRLAGGDKVGCWAVIHDPEELRAQTSTTRPEREKLEDLLGKEHFDPDAAQRLMELYATILQERANKRQLARAGAKSNSITNLATEEDNPKADWREVDLNDFSSGQEATKGRNDEGSSTGIILSARLMNQLLFGDIDGKVDGDDSEGESELDENRFGENNRLGLTSEKEEKRPVDPGKEILFLVAAKKARERYVSDLFSGDDFERKGPYRLLEDLQVLTAPMHYMLNGGAIGAGGFRAELVQILRAFLGNNHAPFISAVRTLAEQDLLEFWRDTPAFHLLHLMVYNACLADVIGSRRKEDRPGFMDALPVMWLRHVIRTVPSDLLPMLEGKSSGMIPLLRCGTFWIAEKLWTRAEMHSFPDFVSAMIRDSALLDALDREFDHRFAHLLGKSDFQMAENEGVPVLGRKARGEIGIGWVEEDKIFIHNSAFQRPEEGHFYEQMQRVEKSQAISLQLLEKNTSLLDEVLIRSIDLARRINP